MKKLPNGSSVNVLDPAEPLFQRMALLTWEQMSKLLPPSPVNKATMTPPGMALQEPSSKA